MKPIRDELKDLYKARGHQGGDLTNSSQTIAGMVNAIRRAEEAESVLSPLTVSMAPADTDFWGKTGAQLQDDIEVNGEFITGSLLEDIDEDGITTKWGTGYFIGLKLTNIDAQATKILCGMDPSISSGLVDITDDPDKITLCKVTYKNTQVFTVIQYDAAGHKLTQKFSLSGLTLVPADAE